MPYVHTSFRLTPELRARLDRLVQETGRHRSDLIETILRDALKMPAHHRASPLDPVVRRDVNANELNSEVKS